MIVGNLIKAEKTCILQRDQCPFHFKESLCPNAARQGRPLSPADLNDLRPEVGRAVTQPQKGSSVTWLEIFKWRHNTIKSV